MDQFNSLKKKPTAEREKSKSIKQSLKRNGLLKVKGWESPGPVCLVMRVEAKCTLEYQRGY